MNPLVLRAILAALPLLGFARRIQNGFVYGIVGAGFFIAAIFTFLLIRTFLPRTAERLSFLLLLLVLAMAAEKFFSVSLFMFASLLLLAPPELFQKRKHWKGVARNAIWTSFVFSIFLTAHGFFSEWLGLGAGIKFFQHPAGSYFLAGLVLAGFPQSRSKK